MQYPLPPQTALTCLKVSPTNNRDLGFLPACLFLRLKRARRKSKFGLSRCSYNPSLDQPSHAKMCLDKRPLYPYLPDRASPQKADMANTTADAMNPKTIETQTMITALKGTAIRVPNLYGILKGWPVKANINYKRLIPVIESTFDRYARQNVYLEKSKSSRLTSYCKNRLVKPSQLREKYRKANYARFVSL